MTTAALVRASVHRVPVGRRVMFADRRRGVLTVAGVVAALLLVLVLDAVFAGALARVTYYIRTSPADVLVSQAGVRTMHMSASALPPGTVDGARAAPGVAWADPIGFASGASLGGPAGRQLTYVIGYDPSTGHGGPTRLDRGRPPGAGEVVIDELAADQLGLEVGSTATVLGAPLRVTGLASGGTSITNTTVFVTREQFAALRGPATSYLLVRADGVTPETLARRLADTLPGATAQTREQFAESESRIVTDMSADLLRLMSLIGLLIALAVIALGLLTSTLARLRDYAVLKALGAGTGRLAGTVASQVLWTVSLALATATGLVLLLAGLLPTIAPTVQLSVTAGSVTRVGVAALLAGTLAALLPLRRLATIDAATAFRETR